MIDFRDNDIIQDYLEMALSHCVSVTKKSQHKFNFRCNICKDSQKSLKKKRAWILKNRHGVWLFNCFNSCGTMQGWKWLKVFFPDVYRDYVKAVLRGKSKPDYYKPVKIEPVKEVVKEEKKKYPFKSIGEDLKICHDAIQYCEQRKIPKEIYQKFFVCEEGDYQGRLIIPYYNKENKIYYFSGRSLYNQEPKYLFSESEKHFYNIYNIDKTKPVIILEGMIDSIFCDNSIGIGALRMSESQTEAIKGLDIHYLLDSDESGRKKSLHLLKEGKSVFIWKKFIKDNGLPSQDKYDLNEVYVKMNRTKNFSYDELKKYFTTNYINAILLK